ncbi:glyoxylase-like metal-dependent hydrolase (beta-lactamase superfamily II) [Clostridium acetobutylicum]|uniref:Zn-dependent hydrolases, glyoxylase family n=1 Tax=Clostridium acetobutylicum (strain ATCC 824 / DSM 792 / JCM 1419 / IAM 19013 / LMG 5710 / NBRC 13948 / NRRL B-527 / VKM B-1787 / 2291 / W) TaxID=272562 RepID=Q97JA0_CLOAB|nr:MULTISPECIES: MBL fold metallo-hydrolase [Clostridium]AAK79354.1 Zn-dependent hydrolases, glyoxylase family [Clostridium acetobutylicum ATCC 824]ADZ20437.1 Zn-dependent hydrolase, glyoxylase family [Clostridium acetobutylicum EA 2018]AEI34583.1 zinc-dependent hydrolase [Clostridium acetobutylicum DSM 1731]AWV81397.1 MBL fold metallo-hydrolase [Clostridium acetobutylicum]MBC2393032.1 MBL fold metallo-hydrolase [Clostridium acetobutylicum]
MKIVDGVEMLELESNVMGKKSVINVTLLYDEENVVLVDTGFPGMSAYIREAVEKAGVALDKVNKIILTHQDIDHIGSLASIIKESNKKIEVFSHEEEKPYIEGTKTPLKLVKFQDKANTSDQIRAICEKLKIGFEMAKSPVNTTLKDGEKLPFCGGIEVIQTPGHTFGHICLYIEKSKLLIAGDALGAQDGVLMLADPLFDFDSNLSKKSLEKLTKYDIETVICYHGGLVKGNVNERIKELIK